MTNFLSEQIAGDELVDYKKSKKITSGASRQADSDWISADGSGWDLLAGQQFGAGTFERRCRRSGGFEF